MSLPTYGRGAADDWRRRAVIYQVYPKSFRDASGDGVGDLRGIIEALPYIARLGADIVWLSPIFASPMVDNGYDVADYTAVHPAFGTIEDVDELVAEAKRRGLRILLDIALNHTSTAHAWFQAACADPNGPFANHYIWRPAEPGAAPPNNWESVFGGPAWSTPDGVTNRAYLHLFDKTQADLNWDHPPVRHAIYDAMRFWLNRGIGGFRLDVVTLISKDPALADIPALPLLERYRLWANGPNLHAYLKEMHHEVFAHYDCLAIGEAPGFDPARAAAVVDPADPMLDMIYHFDLVEPKRNPDGSWDRAAFKAVFREWDGGIGPRGWNSVVLSNHDLARLVNRFGDPAYRAASATMLLTLVLMQRATPVIYQGDELGLLNTPFASMDELDDVWAKTTYRLARETGRPHEAAFAKALAITRDHARTPFPWSDEPNQGFSATRPWLRTNPLNAPLNAAAQERDGSSVLAFAKRVLALRRDDPALWALGTWTEIAPEREDVFVIRREGGGCAADVVLNLTGAPAPAPVQAAGSLLLGNYPTPPEPGLLRPYEARVSRL